VSSPLEELLERTVQGLGYELADLEISSRGKMIRLFIDKQLEVLPGDRITLEDCERVTRQLQRVLPVEGIEYDRLEVSSPGLDRKLRKAADFVRFAGAEVEIRLRVVVNGRRRLVGLLRGMAGEKVELEVDGAPMEIDLPNIERARLVPKL
jgi:ribosome maturation factor RimP